METFWESVRIMLFTYALAAVISFAVAWVIKLVFSGIKIQKSRADARNGAKAAAAAEAAGSAPEETV